MKGDGLSFGKNKEDTYGLALDCGPYGENCSDKYRDPIATPLLFVQLKYPIQLRSTASNLDM